jgi:hypothetical protein
MQRSFLGVALRVVAVVGIVGAGVMEGSTAHATDNVSFITCSTSPSPTPTGTPPDASPTPTPTPDNCVPASGTAVRDVRTLKFSVATNTFNTHIDEVVAFLDSQTNGIASPSPDRIELQCPTGDEDGSKPGCQSSNAAPRNGIYNFVWDTNDVTPYNGAYRFRVKAHFVGTNHDAYVTQPSGQQCPQGCNLIVDNPPQQPNAPRVVVATDKSVSLAWDANPEPDVLSYTLYRAITKDSKTPPTDSQFKVDFTTTGTSARDPVTTAGAYWYKVQATRRSLVTPDTGISSTLSARSGPGVTGPVATPTPKPGTKKTSGKVVALPPPAAAILTPPGLIPSVAAAPPPVPDAPYSAYLPYKSSGTSEDAGPPAPEAGAGTVDPRGAVLPVAVGAFLVTSALALGRMPF